MREDKEIDREVLGKLKNFSDERWKYKEKIQLLEYKYQGRLQEIIMLKKRMRKSRYKLCNYVNEIKRNIGVYANTDLILDEEFDEVYGIEHLSKITLGIQSHWEYNHFTHEA